MFEILCAALFIWIFFGVFKLLFKVAWSLVKLVAVLLLIMALPSLIGCLLCAGGMLLLLPVALIAGAWVLLKLFA